MDKRPIGYIPGKGNPLDKKIPKSTKYQNVVSSLQTGKTVKDIEVISNNTVARRKGELFKRIKTSTLFNLLNQETVLESIYDLANQHENQVVMEEQKEKPKLYYQQMEDNQSVYSSASRHSQQSEVSKVSAITYATQQLGITDQTSFLLLDLRDPEDFTLFHIKESINFPSYMLSRDKVIPQLHHFVIYIVISKKNQEGKLIIIYHFDEKHGMSTANLFSEKGFDNVFLLSGGIESFLQSYPELVEGKKVPVLPKLENVSNKILKRSNYKEIDDKQSVNFVRDPETMSQISQKRSIKDSASQISKTTKKSKLIRHNSQQR